MTIERSPLESFQAPEQYEAYLSRRYERVFFSSVGAPDVGTCLQAARNAHTNTRASILHLEAIPGSGKTHLAAILSNYLKLDPTARVRMIHWDTIEEQIQSKEYKEYVWRRALNAGSPHQAEYKALFLQLTRIGSSLKRPEKELPYPNDFLKIVNRVLCLQLAETIARREPNTWIIIDKPGGTGVKYGSHWLRAREYGMEDIDNLVHENGVFQGIDRSTYHLTTIGLVPSPWQQVGFTMYRRLLSDPGITFAEANDLNRVFGLEPFSTQEEFQRASGGGTKLQVEHANDMTSEIIKITLPASRRILRNYRDILYPSFVREIFEGKEPEIPEGDFIAKEMMEMARRLSEIFGEPLTSVLNLMSIGLGSGRILENTFNIGEGGKVRSDLEDEAFKPDNYIIAYNDPEPFYAVPGLLQRLQR